MSPLKKLEAHYRRQDPDAYDRFYDNSFDDHRRPHSYRVSDDDFEEDTTVKRRRLDFNDTVYPDSPSKDRGESKPPANFLSLCLQSSDSDSEVSIFSEAPGEKFRDLIKAIADNSDLTALPALVFGTSRVVRLPSEKAVDRQQSLTLSTSKAFGLMMEAWFDEFRREDHSRDSLRAQQFHSIFKAREHRPSLHLFRSADDLLPTTVATNPSLAYPWIVQPTRRFDLKECNVWHSRRRFEHL